MSAILNYEYFVLSADIVKNNRYQSGLSQALKRFGVDQVILKTVERQHNEDTFAIVAHNQLGQALGGIRIEVKTPNNKLPLEKCQTRYQNIIQQKINSTVTHEQIIVEICGLWSHPMGKGLNLGENLAFEATQLAIDLGADVITSMLPSHTIKHFTRLGYFFDREIPPMAYPDDRYLSTVVWYYSPRPPQIKFVENQFNLDV